MSVNQETNHSEENLQEMLTRLFTVARLLTTNSVRPRDKLAKPTRLKRKKHKNKNL